MRTGLTLLAAIAVFSIGAHALLTRRNMIRICLALCIMESAVLLMLVALAWRPGATAPILAPGMEAYVDPLPHALALTAIVIGAGFTALALALAVSTHRSLGTVDMERVWKSIR